MSADYVPPRKHYANDRSLPIVLEDVSEHYVHEITSVSDFSNGEDVVHFNDGVVNYV